MKYRFVLLLCILSVCMFASPASADLHKIAKGATVFIGETSLDLSSALDGSRSIAWWPPGNTTDTPPGLILNLTESQAFSFDISPDIFANRTGTWYRYYPKPNTPLFIVKKSAFNLTVWDLDHKKDVTGTSIPRSTKVTYRIETNMDAVFSELQRPESTPLDSFMKVTLTAPSGKVIQSVYTASPNVPGVNLYLLETAPVVKSSPYLWKHGAEWNRSARSVDGTSLYPLGTYTFTATQSLNGMQDTYGATDTRVATGPRTITFVADEPVVTTVTTKQQATVTETAATTTEPVTMVTTEEIPQPTETVKTTWTSAPLPPQIALLAVALVSAVFLYRIRRLR